MKFFVLILICSFYLIFSSIIQYKIFKSKKFEPKQKLAQSLLLWLIPILGAFLVNWMNNIKQPEGSHKNKIPSWKRLVKYDENGYY